MDKVKVIVKRERNRYTNGWELVLFFPETPVSRLHIECWSPVGEHCEADIGYFWSLKNPREEHEEEVTKLISLYEKHYSVAGGFKLVRVRRDTDKMRRARWVR